MTARNSRMLLMAAAFLAGLALCFGVVLILAGRLSSPVAQQIAAIGGPFKLVDQNGQVVTDQDLKGHPFLVFFGFTHCPDVCPTTLFEVSEILRALGPDADRTRALFITVDPERDTPDVLKKKAAEMNAQPGRWVFLTGTKEQIDAAARAMLQVRPGPGDNPLMHSTRFLLFDAQNRCRGRYDSADEAELAKLTKDAAMLSTQAKGAKQ